MGLHPREPVPKGENPSLGLAGHRGVGRRRRHSCGSPELSARLVLDRTVIDFGRLGRRRDRRDGSVGRPVGSGRRHIGEPTSDLQRQLPQPSVVRILGERGPKQPQPLGQSPRFDVGMRVTQRLFAHPLARLFPALEQRFDLLEPPRDPRIPGPELRQQTERPVGGAQIAATKLLERLPLQGRLLHHGGGSVSAEPPRDKRQAHQNPMRPPKLISQRPSSARSSSLSSTSAAVRSIGVVRYRTTSSSRSPGASRVGSAGETVKTPGSK